MAYAVAGDFIILTHDLDFNAILAVTHGKKPSVVQIRSENLDPQFIGSEVVLALRQMQLDLESGALVTIDTKTNPFADSSAVSFIKSTLPPYTYADGAHHHRDDGSRDGVLPGVLCAVKASARAD